MSDTKPGLSLERCPICNVGCAFGLSNHKCGEREEFTIGRTPVDEDTRTEIARENVRRARIGAIVEYTESDDARFQLLSEMALMAGLNARDAAWFASATLQAVRVEREACAQIAESTHRYGKDCPCCSEVARKIRERT